MAKFNAKNNMQEIRDLFIERARYKLLAYDTSENILGPEQVVDFNFGERAHYGRINSSGNAVIPKSTALKAVSNYGSSGNTVLLVNFVSDAAMDLRERMNKACRLGIIGTNNPFLSTMEIERGYTSPQKLYDDYMAQLMSAYNNSFLATSPKLGEILTFDNYVAEFINFSKRMGPQHPITLTGWHRSKHSTIFSTGLAFAIANLPIDDDMPKAEKFIDSPEWNFFAKAAKYHGFSISKNAPWVLVADLRSPAMKRYMGRYSYTTTETLFNQGYRRVKDIEIPKLKNIMLQGYNNFVRANPYHKEIRLCENNDIRVRSIEPINLKAVNKTKQILTSRKLTNINSINNKYNRIMYNIYIKIRNIEEGSPFKKADLQRIIDKTSFFLGKIGPKRTLTYINEQFRSLYKFKDGGNHYHKKRNKIKKESRDNPKAAPAFEGESVGGVLLPDPTRGSY
jgi:hypothetical protein